MKILVATDGSRHSRSAVDGTVKLSEIGRKKATREDRNSRISGHSQTALDAPEGGNLPKLTVPCQALGERMTAFTESVVKRAGRVLERVWSEENKEPGKVRYRKQITGGGLQQNTGNRRIRIYYPFHPLAGQSLWIRERRKGPPPTYTLEASNGECFNVPVWMTEESTARLHLEGSPRLHVRKLLELVALIHKKLEPIGCQQGILQSDQTKEDAHDDRPTPVTTTTRQAATQPTSSSRRPQEKRRDHRADAATRAQNRGTAGTGGAP